MDPFERELEGSLQRANLVELVDSSENQLHKLMLGDCVCGPLFAGDHRPGLAERLVDDNKIFDIPGAA